MNYIYDIYLNFNNIPYDFFEWNKNDNLIHLKKIPIYKVKTEVFNLMYSNNIKIDNVFLNGIRNKTEIWKRKKNITYCALFCTDYNALAIIFNKNGESIKKSNLYIDEEFEILESVKNIKTNKINFQVLKRNSQNLYTRSKLQKYRFIVEELKNIKEDKLKYVYFECFNKYSNKEKMFLELKNINYKNKNFEKLYNILKLISTIQK